MKQKPLKKQLIEQFYHKNKLFFTIAIIASLLTGSLNLILSWLIQQLIDAASGSSGCFTLKTLTLISIGFIFLCIGSLLLDYISEPRYIEKAIRQYKDFAFQKLTQKGIASFSDETTATYLSALTNDATSIENDYISQQFTLITKFVMFVGSLGMMLWYSPLMTAISAGLTILPLAASVMTGNKLAPAERKVSDRNKDFTSSLTDCLTGFTVVKSFQAEKEIFQLFSGNNQTLEKEKFHRRRIKNMVSLIGATTGIFAQLGVFIVGTYLSVSGHGLTPGTVIMFVNLMGFLVDPIAELPGLLASRKAAKGLIGKLADALEQNNEKDGGTDIHTLTDGIHLSHVSFGYEENKEILHDISTTLEAGKSYAIVGGSGSGKSTLLNLLMASNSNYSGEIRFDHTELRKISSSSLYRLISIIQQNVFVFNASIRDNITMFRNFSEDAIHSAIEHAHLNTLMEKCGDQYLCGENGKGLSGGEKQRISIARSLLKSSAVLFADEVTAALDPQTAYQVSSDILDLEGITRVVITHALDEALLKRYDRILVMKDGCLTEQGTFDELMAKKDYFYALYTVVQ